MHVRKQRRAKTAAFDFVQRVIRHQDTRRTSASGRGSTSVKETANENEAPVGKPAVAPVGKPAAAAVGKPAAAPVGRPAAAPGGRPAAAPGGRPAAAPGGKSAAAPVGKPAASRHGTRAATAKLNDAEKVQREEHSQSMTKPNKPAGKSTGRDTPVLDETKRAGHGSPHTRSSRKLKGSSDLLDGKQSVGGTNRKGLADRVEPKRSKKKATDSDDKSSLPIIKPESSPKITTLPTKTESDSRTLAWDVKPDSSLMSLTKADSAPMDSTKSVSTESISKSSAQASQIEVTSNPSPVPKLGAECLPQAADNCASTKKTTAIPIAKNSQKNIHCEDVGKMSEPVVRLKMLPDDFYDKKVASEKKLENKLDGDVIMDDNNVKQTVKSGEKLVSCSKFETTKSVTTKSETTKSETTKSETIKPVMTKSETTKSVTISGTTKFETASHEIMKAVTEPKIIAAKEISKRKNVSIMAGKKSPPPKIIRVPNLEVAPPRALIQGDVPACVDSHMEATPSQPDDFHIICPTVTIKDVTHDVRVSHGSSTATSAGTSIPKMPTSSMNLLPTSTYAKGIQQTVGNPIGSSVNIASSVPEMNSITTHVIPSASRTVGGGFSIVYGANSPMKVNASATGSPIIVSSCASNVGSSPMKQDSASKNLFPLAFSGTSLVSELPVKAASKPAQNRRKQKLTTDNIRSEYEKMEEVVPEIVHTSPIKNIKQHKASSGKKNKMSKSGRKGSRPSTPSEMARPGTPSGSSRPSTPSGLSHPSTSSAVGRPLTPSGVTRCAASSAVSSPSHTFSGSNTPTRQTDSPTEHVIIKKSPPIMSVGVAAALKKILSHDYDFKMEPDDDRDEREQEYEKLWTFGDSSLHPTEHLSKNVYLKFSGLVSRKELSNAPTQRNKLHREAGGKLRRNVKPRVVHDMVFTSRTSVPSQSVKRLHTGAFTRQRKEDIAINATRMLSTRSSSMTTRSSTPEKLTTRSSKCELRSTKSFPPAGTSAKTKPAKASKAAPAKEKSCVANSDKAHVITTKILNKVHKAVDAVIDMKDSDNVTSIGRRSGRHQGVERKKWKHLLKAAPDEHMAESKWDRPQEQHKKRSSKKKVAESMSPSSSRASTPDNDVEIIEELTQPGGLVSPKVQNRPLTMMHKSKKVSAQRKREFIRELNAAHAIDLTCDVSRSSSSSDNSVSRDTKRVMVLGKQGQALDIDTGSLRAKSVVGCITDNPQAGYVYDLPLNDKSTDGDNQLMRAGQKRCRVTTSGNVARVSNFREIEPRECIIPHMCTVCWRNDHMYCGDMHRVESDLPLYGGCLHYMPCQHYSKQQADQTDDKPLDLSIKYTDTINSYIFNQRNGQKALDDINTKVNTINQVTGTPRKRRHSESDVEESLKGTPRKNSSPLTRTTSLEDLTRSTTLDLTCNETLEESPNDPSSPETPAGTEVLRTQLRARASQIVRSLGFQETSVTNSMRAVRNNMVAGITSNPEDSDSNDEIEVSETEVDIEEHAYNVVMSVDGTQMSDDLSQFLLSESSLNEGESQQDMLAVVEGLSPLGLVEVQPLNFKQRLRLKLTPDVYNPPNKQDDTKTQAMVRVKVISTDNKVIVLQQIEDPASDIYTRLPTAQIEIDNPLKLEIPESLLSWEYDKATSDEDSSECELQNVITLEYDSPNKIFRPLIKKAFPEANDESAISTPWVLQPMEDFLSVNKHEDDDNDEDCPRSGKRLRLESGDVVEISDEEPLDYKTGPTDGAKTSRNDRSQPVSLTPIKIQGTSSELPDELQKLSQARLDGSQILTFTTKDIRLGDPHLISYIQESGLAPTVFTKLDMERKSTEKMIQKKLASIDGLKTEIYSLNAEQKRLHLSKSRLHEQNRMQIKVFKQTNHAYRSYCEQRKLHRRLLRKFSKCVKNLQEYKTTPLLHHEISHLSTRATHYLSKSIRDFANRRDRQKPLQEEDTSSFPDKTLLAAPSVSKVSPPVHSGPGHSRPSEQGSQHLNSVTAQLAEMLKGKIERRASQEADDSKSSGAQMKQACLMSVCLSGQKIGRLGPVQGHLQVPGQSKKADNESPLSNVSSPTNTKTDVSEITTASNAATSRCTTDEPMEQHEAPNMDTFTESQVKLEAKQLTSMATTTESATVSESSADCLPTTMDMDSSTSCTAPSDVSPANSSTVGEAANNISQKPLKPLVEVTEPLQLVTAIPSSDLPVVSSPVIGCPQTVSADSQLLIYSNTTEPTAVSMECSESSSPVSSSAVTSNLPTPSCSPTLPAPAPVTISTSVPADVMRVHRSYTPSPPMQEAFLAHVPVSALTSTISKTNEGTTASVLDNFIMPSQSCTMTRPLTAVSLPTVRTNTGATVFLANPVPKPVSQSLPGRINIIRTPNVKRNSTTSATVAIPARTPVTTMGHHVTPNRGGITTTGQKIILVSSDQLGQFAGKSSIVVKPAQNVVNNQIVYRTAAHTAVSTAALAPVPAPAPPVTMNSPMLTGHPSVLGNLIEEATQPAKPTRLMPAFVTKPAVTVPAVTLTDTLHSYVAKDTGPKQMIPTASNADIRLQSQHFVLSRDKKFETPKATTEQGVHVKHYVMKRNDPPANLRRSFLSPSSRLAATNVPIQPAKSNPNVVVEEMYPNTNFTQTRMPPTLAEPSISAVSRELAMCLDAMPGDHQKTNSAGFVVPVIDAEGNMSGVSGLDSVFPDL